MECPNCHETIKDGQRFCSSCGQALKPEQSQPLQNNATSANQEDTLARLMAEMNSPEKKLTRAEKRKRGIKKYASQNTIPVSFNNEDVKKPDDIKEVITKEKKTNVPIDEETPVAIEEHQEEVLSITKEEEPTLEEELQKVEDVEENTRSVETAPLSLKEEVPSSSTSSENTLPLEEAQDVPSPNKEPDDNKEKIDKENAEQGSDDSNVVPSSDVKEPIQDEKKESSSTDLKEELHKMCISDEMEKSLYSITDPNVLGLKCFFLGNSGTYKEKAENNLAELLYKQGKLSTSSPCRIDFISLPNSIEEKKLYVIGDLSTAISQLFNLEDYSDEATDLQNKYKKVLSRLVSAPMNSYIIIDGTQDEYKGFISLDARTRYIYDKKIAFPDLTNREVVERYEKALPASHKSQFTKAKKENMTKYLDRNRRYFPFNNQDLANYLLDYSTRQAELKLPPEKYNPKTLEDTFSQIIGVENVKSQVRELAQYLSVRNKLIDAGAKLPDFNLHMMFLGNPGVGKTSIARIISKLLFDLGYLREEKLIEVTSKDLVGGYGNQTGIKTNKAIMSALGGVLFVDEAYSLSNSCGQAGAEAIAILIKAMMDYKDDLVVMFAGYSLEMRSFVDSNSGISSRISYIFNFEDYTASEMYDIFILKLKNIGMTINENAIPKVKDLCKNFAGRRNAGNGRFVDNLIQKSLTRHALLDLPKDKILELQPQSIPTIAELMSTIFN